MNFLKFLKGKYLKWISERESRHFQTRELINTIDPNHFPDSLKNPTDYYLRAFQDFQGSVFHQVFVFTKIFAKNVCPRSCWQQGHEIFLTW